MQHIWFISFTITAEIGERGLPESSLIQENIKWRPKTQGKQYEANLAPQPNKRSVSDNTNSTVIV